VNRGQLTNADLLQWQKEQEEQTAAMRREDLGAIMGTESGRRFVHRLIYDLGKLDSLSLEGGIKDGVAMAQLTAANEGRRELALTLADEARREFPQLWLALLGEAANRERDFHFKRQKMAEGENHG